MILLVLTTIISFYIIRREYLLLKEIRSKIKIYDTKDKTRKTDTKVS